VYVHLVDRTMLWYFQRQKSNNLPCKGWLVNILSKRNEPLLDPIFNSF
jgi:hypothetical protein